MAKPVAPAAAEQVERVSGRELSTRLFLERYAADSRQTRGKCEFEFNSCLIHGPHRLLFSVWLKAFGFHEQGQSFCWTWCPPGLRTKSGVGQMASPTWPSLRQTSEAITAVSLQYCYIIAILLLRYFCIVTISFL